MLLFTVVLVNLVVGVVIILVNHVVSVVKRRPDMTFAVGWVLKTNYLSIVILVNLIVSVVVVI